MNALELYVLLVLATGYIIAINEAVSDGVLTPPEIRQIIQGLTVSLLPPEEAGVLDPVSHRIKKK